MCHLRKIQTLDGLEIFVLRRAQFHRLAHVILDLAFRLYPGQANAQGGDDDNLPEFLGKRPLALDNMIIPTLCGGTEQKEAGIFVTI
jgi:hypothetical protein